MKTKRLLIREVVIFGSLAAALVALTIRMHASPYHAFVQFMIFLQALIFLSIVPLIIIEMIVSAIAKARKRAISAAWVWSPGLAYIYCAAVSGWVMGASQTEDPTGISPFILITMYVWPGVLILGAALTSGLIGAFWPSKMSK